MTYNIVTLPGGGIGPEILNESLLLLEIISNKYNFNYQMEHHEFGGTSIGTFGKSLTEETLNACKRADVILLGAVGGPKWTDPSNRPEQGLLKSRKSLNLFVSVRPTTVVKGASSSSPSKEEHVGGTDSVIVRELTGGIYFGEPRHFNNHEVLDSLTYTRGEIERIVHIAFKLTASRREKLTSVDKEDVLASNKLWCKVVNGVSQLYSEVTINHLPVDACSMRLIANPRQFDVIVCENLFGDILSDEASVIPDPLGLSPSASFSNDNPGLYEPIHGSAPDTAGKNVANPSGMILSLVMCLRKSLSQPDATDELEQHTYSMIGYGWTIADLGGRLSTTDIFEVLSQKLNH